MKFRLDEAISKKQQAEQIVQNSFQKLDSVRHDISDAWLSVDISDLKNISKVCNQINDASLKIIHLIANFTEMSHDYKAFISSGNDEYFDDLIVDEIYFKEDLDDINKRLPTIKTTDLDIQYTDDDWSDFQFINK